MRAAKTGTPQNRRRASEQGFHQRGQLDHAVTGVSHPDAGLDRQAARHRRHLGQEPALAQAGPAFHQGDGSRAGQDLVKVAAQGRELAVAAADRLRGHRSPRPQPRQAHQGPFG